MMMFAQDRRFNDLQVMTEELNVMMEEGLKSSSLTSKSDED